MVDVWIGWICNELRLLVFSVSECDGLEHLQRWLRLLLPPMGPSQSGYLLQTQSQSF